MCEPPQLLLGCESAHTDSRIFVRGSAAADSGAAGGGGCWRRTRHCCEVQLKCTSRCGMVLSHEQDRRYDSMSAAQGMMQ